MMFGIVTLLVLWLVILPPAMRYFERKNWNKGRCKHCDLKWRPFDVDSSNAYGYACDRCNDVIWISWIKKELKK